ncbi:hypothetical protein ACDY99_17010, partial [Achromobacter dolens]|uniref:hypothetical protein n=1 Tax=Achromobacter dolens TaxID=1287738 RepID=UPI0035579769
ATMLLYQTHGAVTDFRGKLVLLAHKGSILSKVGASAKPGAIQSYDFESTLEVDFNDIPF